MVDWNKKSDWKGLTAAQNSVVLITEQFDEMVWFYRNMLGSSQNKPFFNDENNKGVWVELQFGNITLIIANKKFYENKVLSDKVEVKTGSRIIEIYLGSNDLLADVMDMVEEIGLVLKAEMVTSIVDGVKRLVVPDPDGNMLVIRGE